MLSTAFHLQNIEAPYKSSHANHPVSKWVRQSNGNFNWTIRHACELFLEKAHRTNKGHKSIEVVEWAMDNQSKLSFNSKDMTPFAVAIPQTAACRNHPDFNTGDVIKKYQLYYKYDKANISFWSKREIPSFMF